MYISSSGGGGGLSKEEKKRLKLEQKKKEKIQRTMMMMMMMCSVPARLTAVCVCNNLPQHADRQLLEHATRSYFFSLFMQ